MSGWPSAPLGEICEINVGRTPFRNRREYWGQGALWLSIADMNQGRDLQSTKEQITELAASEAAGKLVQPGTVLLSFKLSIGKVGIARTPLFTNEAIVALPIRRSDRILPQYLYWALRSINLTGNTNRAVLGQTLNKAKLQRVQVPLPPINEQRRIGEVLDRADELRAKRRKALAHLDDLTQSIFLDMLGDPIHNPFDWDSQRTLADVAEISSGITKGRRLGAKPTRSVPYLAVANVQDKKLDLSTVKQIEATESEIDRYRLERDDLLLTEGGDPDKLGRGSLWNEELPEVIHQNHIFRVRINKGADIEPVYLNWLISSQRGKSYFLRSAKQTTGIASINMAQLRKFPLLLPPLKMQQEFTLRVRAVEELKAKYRASLAELDALFASLQDRAFRGLL
jgi:type I restriction enzyme S subunit